MFVLVTLLGMKYPITGKTLEYGVLNSNYVSLVSKLNKLLYGFKKSSRNYLNFLHYLLV